MKDNTIVLVMAPAIIILLYKEVARVQQVSQIHTAHTHDGVVRYTMHFQYKNKKAETQYVDSNKKTASR